MAVELSDDDKEMIRLIDVQVGRLLDRKASSHIILYTLSDLIPDAKCMANAICEKQMDLYCKEYQGFNCFLQLIAQL